jgi:hypothetical protein
MSAKTAPALNPGADPVTPVIIKSGGGNEDPEDPRQVHIEPQVKIESPHIPFKETVPGLLWVSSQSTLFGRITALEIHDGATTTHHRLEPSDHLASVTLKFGSAQVIAMESGVASEHSVLLLLTSPEVPFSMLVGSQLTGDWNSSSTNFPQQMTNVLLMVGNHQRLSYQCETPGVEVRIKFEQV